MKLNEFIEEFVIACDFIDVPVLESDTLLDDIPDFDSLAMLGVIVLFETKFGITATGEEIRAQRSIRGLYNFAVKK